MGDKSPKAKNKANQQHTADKNQKKDAATAKANANAKGSEKNEKKTK